MLIGFHARWWTNAPYGEEGELSKHWGYDQFEAKMYEVTTA